MKNALEIELFKNLSDWDLDNNAYRDLHNDFDCVGIILSKDLLKLRFQGISESTLRLDMIFNTPELVCLNFSFGVPLAGLTLDNLHRGRFEVDGSLVEEDKQRRGYFYTEFYEGPALEFWSKSVALVNLSDEEKNRITHE